MKILLKSKKVMKALELSEVVPVTKNWENF